MREIKILHLYSDLLDLYGDAKNLIVLCNRIRETGNAASVTETQLFVAPNTHTIIRQ